MNRFLQALIAISGLAITGLLTWQGLDNAKRQTRLAYLSLFSEQVNAAVQNCDPDPLRIATDAVQSMIALGGTDQEQEQAAAYQDQLLQISSKIDECSKQRLATLAVQQQQQTSPAPVEPSSNPSLRSMTISPSVAAQVQQVQQGATVAANLDLQLQEGRMRKFEKGDVDPNHWYAVLATYAIGQDEAKVADEVGRLSKVTAGSEAEVVVYVTKASDYYAICLIPKERNRGSAREMVSVARQKGWAPDAFVLHGDDWTACPATDPGSLKSCAANRPKADAAAAN